MKKLLVALFAAALVSLGLVGVTSSPAQADCGYSGPCKATKVSAGDKTVKKGSSTKIPVTVEVKNGSGTPKGEVKVTCTKGNIKRSGSDTLKGGEADVKVGPFTKRGAWDCDVKYVSGPGFKDSSTTSTVTVIRRG